MGSFFNAVVFGNGYDDAAAWLHSPLLPTVVILFLITGFHHAALAVQVVIEDYVHCEVLQAVQHDRGQIHRRGVWPCLGILATVKIFFGV